jgi:pentatricopeptide repeat protein
MLKVVLAPTLYILQLSSRDNNLKNLFLKAFVKCSDFETVFREFDSMVSEGLKPDNYTYLYFIWLY